MKSQLFVEGNDKKFVFDYLVHFGCHLDNNFIVDAQGWNSLENLRSKFLEATDKEVPNYVVFDANGDPVKRRQEILDKGKELGIEFNLFLFPTDFEAGMFEDLLLRIVPSDKQPYLTCFDDYCKQIQAINAEAIITSKSKLFAYLEATGQPTNLKNVNFLDSEYWDLHHDSLKPLREFLEPVISLQGS